VHSSGLPLAHNESRGGSFGWKADTACSLTLLLVGRLICVSERSALVPHPKCTTERRAWSGFPDLALAGSSGACLSAAALI
jgi:hypothetical protein